MRTAVETITPADAAQLLAANDMNRRLRRTLVEKYALDMANGAWTLNGEPILLNGDGGLLDGQHRAAACVEAGVPFETVVVRGVPTDFMPTINTGAPRTLADVLGIEGVSNASVVAGIIKWTHRYDRMVEQGSRQLASGHANISTRTEELEFANDNAKTLTHTAELVTAHSRLLPAAPSVVGFAHFIGSRVYPVKKCDEFVTYICDPAGLKETDSPAVLRAVLLGYQTKSVHRRATPELTAALCVKSLRYWIEGRTVIRLKWNRGASKRKGEPFPRIKG